MCTLFKCLCLLISFDTIMVFVLYNLGSRNSDYVKLNLLCWFRYGSDTTSVTYVTRFVYYMLR